MQSRPRSPREASSCLFRGLRGLRRTLLGLGTQRARKTSHRAQKGAQRPPGATLATIWAAADSRLPWRVAGWPHHCGAVANGVPAPRLGLCGWGWLSRRWSQARLVVANAPHLRIAELAEPTPAAYRSRRAQRSPRQRERTPGMGVQGSQGLDAELPLWWWVIFWSGWAACLSVMACLSAATLVALVIRTIRACSGRPVVAFFHPNR